MIIELMPFGVIPAIDMMASILGHGIVALIAYLILFWGLPSIMLCEGGEFP